MTGFRALV